MASINGDWFHSRSSSNLNELLAVRKLVFESQKIKYVGFAWSGGRHNNEKMYGFSSVANIEPSTMQTKIRSMIRYGFLKDNNTCPLVWTKMGELWNDLFSIGNFTAAKKVYELTLSVSLSIFSFNNTSKQYSLNPANGEMPLKFLLNNLDNNSSISLESLGALIDGSTKRVGKNISYWKKDLINAGLFEQLNNRIVYTKNYPSFVEEIKNFSPNRTLTDFDWFEIRNNPVIEQSPFRNSIKNIFEDIANEAQIANELYTAPLINTIAEQEETQIPELDILSTNVRYSNTSRRIRNYTWSIRIKKKYNYTCAVPKCDVSGRIFLESAHVKPDSVIEGEIPHRSHILNGLCLCKHCHVAFDKGYFSLTDDSKVIASNHFDEIPNQTIKSNILSSNNNTIKQRTDKRFPLTEFIQYHRKIKFKG